MRGLARLDRLLDRGQHLRRKDPPDPPAVLEKMLADALDAHARSVLPAPRRAAAAKTAAAAAKTRRCRSNCRRLQPTAGPTAGPAASARLAAAMSVAEHREDEGNDASDGGRRQRSERKTRPALRSGRRWPPSRSAGPACRAGCRRPRERAKMTKGLNGSIWSSRPSELCRCAGRGAGSGSPSITAMIRSTPAEMPPAKSPLLNFGVMISSMMRFAVTSVSAPSRP